jgi:hypothetical protein
VTEGPERAEELGVEAEGETEEVDAVLVPAGEASLPAQAAAGRAPAPHAAGRQALAGLRQAPSAQAVALATGGFLAGAVVVGLTRRRYAIARRGRGQRRLIRGGRGRRGRKPASRAGAAELLQVVGSRSFLVDVHVLAPVVRQR